MCLLGFHMGYWLVGGEGGNCDIVRGGVRAIEHFVTEETARLHFNHMRKL